jgi:cyclin-dependent kinase 7
VRGTPTKENWPNVTTLPDYLEFSQMKPAELNKIFPMMSAQGLDLLD